LWCEGQSFERASFYAGSREKRRKRRLDFFAEAVGVLTLCREGSACGVSADSWTLVPRYSVAFAPYDRTKYADF